MNKVLVSLGSNQDKEKNIRLADQLLSDYCVSIRFSKAVYTKPVDMQNQSLFLNQVAIAFSPERPDEITNTFKRIERQLGRAVEDKSRGRVLIDIDLLQWNDRVLKPDDLQRPYVQSALGALSDTGQEDERSNQ